ncbi:MAG: serine protease [Verrucomicrobiota bacterium]
MAVFLDMVEHPKPCRVELLPQSTTEMRGRDLARRAAAAYVNVGWVFQCSKCSRWHAKLAGGYAIAPDTVVTARHVVNPPENMMAGTGIPVVVRGEEEILPVSGIVAANVGMDTVVMKVLCKNLAALPLRGEIEVGDPVYCLSDPAGCRGIFTTGIVNHTSVPLGDPADKLARSRLTVSTDWAPGSSGSAILDSCGNAVGHVSTIQPVFGKKSDSAPEGATEAGAPVAMSLHHAVPAGSVRLLLGQSR